MGGVTVDSQLLMFSIETFSGLPSAYSELASRGKFALWTFMCISRKCVHHMGGIETQVYFACLLTIYQLCSVRRFSDYPQSDGVVDEANIAPCFFSSWRPPICGYLFQ